MPDCGSRMSNGCAKSSSCSKRCAKRPVYAASITMLCGNPRVMLKLTTCEYGVFNLSSKPQVMANAPADGATGNDCGGGGPYNGHGGALQPPAAKAGMVLTLLKRGASST